MRTLLLPLDGSPFAEQAIPAAVDIARRSGATIAIVGVHEPPVPPFGAHGAPMLDPLFDAERRNALRAYLQNVRDRIRADYGLRAVETTVIEGAPGDALVHYTEHERPDLVVLASHGRSGPSRLWLGSVTDRLVRALTLPVLVVRTAAAHPEATERPSAAQRIVVPLDGSAASEAAIFEALEVCGRDRVSFLLLRVVSPIEPTLGMVATPAEATRYIAIGKELAHEYLAALEQRIRAEGVDADGVVRVDTNAASAICAYAEDVGASLIAMTTHARGAVGRALIGSVADKVVRAATAPVLLCHPSHVRTHANGIGAGAGLDAGMWWAKG